MAGTWGLPRGFHCRTPGQALTQRQYQLEGPPLQEPSSSLPLPTWDSPGFEALRSTEVPQERLKAPGPQFSGRAHRQSGGCNLVQPAPRTPGICSWASLAAAILLPQPCQFLHHAFLPHQASEEEQAAA